MVDVLSANFTITTDGTDLTDVPFGLLTGPLLFAQFNKVSQAGGASGVSTYNITCQYVAGTDDALEYTVRRITIPNSGAVSVDDALATVVGTVRATEAIQVSKDTDNTTYDIIILHLNA